MPLPFPIIEMFIQTSYGPGIQDKDCVDLSSSIKAYLFMVEGRGEVCYLSLNSKI